MLREKMRRQQRQPAYRNANTVPAACDREIERVVRSLLATVEEI
ncbi:MAG TPA: hypothetical protein VK619_03905 [Pyrinomonadaceae bacterium]|nr:hypothetical protein [Pyrinomonadaceae bacterium]